MYASEGEDLTLAAAGDAIVTRRLSTLADDRFERIVELVRGAEASVANLEVLLDGYWGYWGTSSPRSTRSSSGLSSNSRGNSTLPRRRTDS